MIGWERSILSSVVESSPHAVYWKDRQLRFVGCNQNFLQLTGHCDKSTLIGQVEASHPHACSDYRQTLRSMELKVLDSGVDSHFDFDFGASDKHRRTWVRTRLTTLRGSREQSIGVLGTLVDITPYRKTLETLRYSEEHLRQLLKQLPVRLWLVDRDLFLMQCKWDSQMSWIPWSRRRISLFELFAQADGNSLPVTMARRALAGESPRFELNRRDKSYLVCMEPLRHSSGGIIGALALSVELAQLNQKMAHQQQ